MAEASAFGLFVLLAMGHFVGDFVLQNDRMAIEKCAGCDKTLPWLWWLTAHAAYNSSILGLEKLAFSEGCSASACKKFSAGNSHSWVGREAAKAWPATPLSKATWPTMAPAAIRWIVKGSPFSSRPRSLSWPFTTRATPGGKLPKS